MFLGLVDTIPLKALLLIGRLTFSRKGDSFAHLETTTRMFVEAKSNDPWSV
jgi:hypothetical protein